MGYTSYDDDVILWSREQAALLRSGNFAALDIEHIADEVEDVGKSETNELERRMAILLGHMLKWQGQPERRGSSWETTIKVQRNAIARRLRKTPSLKADFFDAEWWAETWVEATVLAEGETGRNDWPLACPWSREQVLDPSFFPD